MRFTSAKNQLSIAKPVSNAIALTYLRTDSAFCQVPSGRCPKTFFEMFSPQCAPVRMHCRALWKWQLLLNKRIFDNN
jgi:hypothetical protein